MAWALVPCLVQLRGEFNRLAPGRDKTTDGSVGDAAHAGTSSDHNPDETGHVPIKDADSVNEVHAIDVDEDLRESDLTMEKVVQFLLGRCRSGAEKRLRYIIFNRRIWEVSNDWRQRAYTGPNPHTEHAHFSASYDTKLEASTASWHLEDLMALTDADKDFIRALFERTAQPDNGGVTSKVGRDALDQGIPNGVTGTKTPAWQVLRDIGTQTKAILLAVSGLAGRDDVDETTVIAGILAGLTPEVFSAALTVAGITPRTIADALPDEFAESMLDALSSRLAPKP